MNPDQKGELQHNELPITHIDALTNSFSQFLRIETASGGILLLAAVIALTLSNSPWADGFRTLWETPIGIRIGAFQFLRSLRDLINDGLMTLFFFIVALEMKREVVLGELRNPRMVALSVAAAAGGMLVPAALYLALQHGQLGQHGWGIVMPTDTAFVIGCLALLGSRVPPGLRVFLLSLAVVDDLAAILVVTVGYSRPLDWIALALGVVGLAMVRGMALLGVRNIRAYFLAGAIIWLAVDASGIHATIVGVILGLMTPTAGWVSDQRLGDILRKVLSYPPGDHWSGNTEDNRALQVAAIAVRETLSPVERLEAMLHPWVAFGIMPLFALANAGVPISSKGLINPVSLAVMAGFVFGKPIGVTGFAWLAVRTGVAIRPAGLSWGALVGGALLTGIGFTMALFIADQAFQDVLLNEAKLGILSASLVSSVAGLTLLSVLLYRNGSLDLRGSNGGDGRT
ncbi:unnamed protein product [Acidocella sp. C78]|nr:unnamed protein product [Acidocella sp. C78]